MISERVRLIFHALLGAALGLFWSIVFLLFYYGQRFSIPVSDAVRMRSAFLITSVITIFVLTICYRNQIIATLKHTFKTYDELEQEPPE
jgi:hypothetical protein